MWIIFFVTLHAKKGAGGKNQTVCKKEVKWCRYEEEWADGKNSSGVQRKGPMGESESFTKVFFTSTWSLRCRRPSREKEKGGAGEELGEEEGEEKMNHEQKLGCM